MSEAYVAWMTNSGMVAIPESEAQARRDGMQNQLGITELRNTLDLYVAHCENLIERVYELERLAGLHDPCPACGGDGHLGPATRSPQSDYGRGCSVCNGSGCNPLPKWERP